MLVKGVRIGSFRGEQLTHRGFSNLSHIKKALCSACTHCSISPQSRGVNRFSCSHPQKARLPVLLSSVGMTTSWSTTQLRKTSLPICVSRGGSHMQFKATVTVGRNGNIGRIGASTLDLQGLAFPWVGISPRTWNGCRAFSAFFDGTASKMHQRAAPILGDGI